METAFEKILISTYKVDTLAFFNAHPACFNEAIKLAISDKQPYSWRATILLWTCMKKNDKRIRKYLPQLIEALPHRKYNQQRELLKVFEMMDLDEDDEGILFNHCVALWEKIESKPSLRFSAFRLMVKIATHHPVLIEELKLLTQEYYMLSLSPAVHKSISKLMHGVEKKK